MTPTFTIAGTGASNFRKYHTKMQLTELNIESSQGTDPGATCRLFGSLPGVAQCWVYRYCLEVEKGAAWTWEEVEPAIVEALAAMEVR